MTFSPIFQIYLCRWRGENELHFKYINKSLRSLGKTLPHIFPSKQETTAKPQKITWASTASKDFTKCCYSKLNLGCSCGNNKNRSHNIRLHRVSSCCTKLHATLTSPQQQTYSLPIQWSLHSCSDYLSYSQDKSTQIILVFANDSYTIWCFGCLRKQLHEHFLHTTFPKHLNFTVSSKNQIYERANWASLFVVMYFTELCFKINS